MAAGVVIALVAAALGGWVIGRQTLRPLTQMAEQASRIGARDLEVRLSAVHSDDELGLLARAFNGLLDRLAAALHQQRQFMADASHELRTPVSVVRTATQVTLAKEARSAEEYRESLVIVGEQANRLSRLVDAMFLLSRAEAQGVPLRREFLNLDDLLAESARALRVLANQRGVTVTTEGDAGGRVHRRRRAAAPDDRQPARQRDPARRPAAAVVVASLTLGGPGVVLRITNDGPAIAAGGPGAHLRTLRPASAPRTAPVWDCRSPDGSPRRMAERCGSSDSRAGLHDLCRDAARRNLSSIVHLAADRLFALHARFASSPVCRCLPASPPSSCATSRRRGSRPT